MADKDKVLMLLGLAKRAGKVTAGGEMTLKDGRAGKLFCVVVAGDVSEGSTKKIRNMCEYYEIPLFTYGEKKTLGKALGRDYCAAAGIQDPGFAKEIEKRILQANKNR